MSTTYRDEQDRLAEWRRSLLWRERREHELDRVPDPGYHARNLAAGQVAKVDSFLGTINTDQVGDAYWALYEVELSWAPMAAPGWVSLRLAAQGPQISQLQLRVNGGPWRSVGAAEAVALADGVNVVEAQVENAGGWRGRLTHVELTYRRDQAWPAAVQEVLCDNGRVAAGRYPFEYETWPEPNLTELRRRFELDRLVAGAAGDLDRMVRLRDWIKSLWAHHLPWRHLHYNGLVILDRASRGVETFICMHYSVALIHCCLSLGMQARLVNLHRGISEAYPIGMEAHVDPPVDEHVVAEVWCAEHGKWVLQDVDFDCHYEIDGVPLSALEIKGAFLDGETAGLTVCTGPGAEQYASLGPDFYQHKLPAYYKHFTILMRNSFLTNPDGPIPALHLTDERTPPILWYRGEDMRLHPHLLGPVVVANPYRLETPRLTDGSLESGWASADAPADHTVEVDLPAASEIRRIVLHWPEWRRQYRTSRSYRMEVREAGRWVTVATVEQNPERPWTVHDFGAVSADAVRVIQPPGGGFPEHPDRLWLTQIEVY